MKLIPILLLAVAISACAQAVPKRQIIRMEVGYLAMDPLLGRNRVWPVYRLDRRILPGLNYGDSVLAQIVCHASSYCEIGSIGKAESSLAKSDDMIVRGHVMSLIEGSKFFAIKLDAPINIPDENLMKALEFEPGKIKSVDVNFSIVDNNLVYGKTKVGDVKSGEPLRWK